MLAPDVESDPPPVELYAAVPESEPVILPFEIRSRQTVAPEVARLDGLAPSNSKVGEEKTAALSGDEYPAYPDITSTTLSAIRVIRETILDFSRQQPMGIKRLE